MKITFLGTGTSHGIPVIGCDCAVCRSSDPKDKRHRCSLYVQSGQGKKNDTAVLIDTGPEFRMQCITHGVRRLDAVLLTHSHADHLHGIDDLRIFSFNLREEIRDKFPQRDPLPIYANDHTKQDIESRFGYIFTPVKEGGGKPNLKLIARPPYESFAVGPFDLQSAPVMHGTLESSGWIIKEARYIEKQGQGFMAAKDHNIPQESFVRQETDSFNRATKAWNAEAALRGIAYLTDCSFVPDKTIEEARGVEHLIIDGLRMKPHNTHFSFNQALECANRIAPRHVWLIHINHERSHSEIDRYLQEAKLQYPNLSGIEVHPACDGQVLCL